MASPKFQSTEPCLRRDYRVSYLLHMVELRLGDPGLTVRGIAAELRLSESGLRQLVRRHLSCGLKRYIQEQRMIRAKELLQSSLLSIKEIMRLVGVNDASHFSRTFKEFSGLAPRHYRQMHFSASRARQSSFPKSA